MYFHLGFFAKRISNENLNVAMPNAMIVMINEGIIFVF